MFLSIDPGLNNCGLSVLDVETHFKVVKTVLVKNARKFTDEEKQVEIAYGSRTVKVLAILNTIEALLTEFPEIDFFTIEAPFYNALTPMAYGSLLEIIFAIKYEIIVRKQLQFKLIEPLLVKKLFTDKSQASKEFMKQFLIQKQAQGIIDINLDVETLSEHEIDSIAIGYVHYIAMKKGEA